MNRNDLYWAFSGVDDSLLARSETPRRRSYRRWGTLAACLVLMAGVAFGALAAEAKEYTAAAAFFADNGLSMEGLSRAGLFTGILMMPILPFLEDNPGNIRDIVARAAGAGARFIYPAMGMTCRAGQREHFYRELEEAFPGQGLAERYQKRYGMRYYCTSPRARALWEVFQEECDRLGLLYSMKEIVAASWQGCESGQLSLF